jgi:lipoate---protein ligase
MHGEYKIPGGKLVVVDLELANGQIQHVQVSGDFFLAPDEALGWIAQAIAGQSAQISEAELSEHIEAALQSAETLGLTAQGIAIAVQRAIRGSYAN